MTAKHTAGPWTFEHRFQSFDGDAASGTSDTAFTEFTVRGADGSIVHDFYDPNQLNGDEIDCEEANARLIAAAPELLEVLEAIEAHCKTGAPASEGQALRVRARAAIAKARGGAE